MNISSSLAHLSVKRTRQKQKSNDDFVFESFNFRDLFFNKTQTGGRKKKKIRLSLSDISQFPFTSTYGAKEIDLHFLSYRGGHQKGQFFFFFCFVEKRSYKAWLHTTVSHSPDKCLREKKTGPFLPGRLKERKLSFFRHEFAAEIQLAYACVFPTWLYALRL